MRQNPGRDGKKHRVKKRKSVWCDGQVFVDDNTIENGRTIYERRRENIDLNRPRKKVRCPKCNRRLMLVNRCKEGSDPYFEYAEEQRIRRHKTKA